MIWLQAMKFIPRSPVSMRALHARISGVQRCLSLPLPGESCPHTSNLASPPVGLPASLSASLSASRPPALAPRLHMRLTGSQSAPSHAFATCRASPSPHAAPG